MSETTRKEQDGAVLSGRIREIRGAIEALSEGFALFDSEDRLVLCNARFRKAHRGLESLLAPGLPWSIFLGESDFRDAARGLDQVAAHLANGLETPLTVEAERPGDRWVRIEVRPTDEGGFVITEMDITDGRAAEELRAEADELLREVLDASPGNMMMSRIGSGEIIYRNPAYLELFGPKDSAIDLYADPVTRSDFLAELLPTGSLNGFEVGLLRADGSIFPGRVFARIVNYKGEEVIVTTVHDMTEVYAQRDEIVRINQRLFDAIEALDQGFALFDSERRLHVANQRYYDVNAPLSDILRPGAANAQIVDAATAKGHEPQSAGWPAVEDVRAEEGRPFEFSLSDGRSFAASRRITSDGGFVLAWRDVTEQKAAERELSRRREASFQNEKLTALGGLLAGVAHELNNPLSVIVGHSMMLREEIEDPALKNGIEKISNSAERCAKIVKTFLALARQKPTKLEAASVTIMLETALDVASYGLPASGTTIETRLADSLPDVLADEDQITQVFINLVVNAGQAVQELGEAGRIIVSAGLEPGGRRVVARVSDNGPGVPEHLRARIFEPFFTTKDVGAGTGVGLALSHRIVGSHGGLLEVGDSEEGGACFTVSLPRASATSASAPGEPAATLPLGLKALVVEDEADVGETIVDMLQSFGVAATLASTAQRGLDLLTEGLEVDVVLSDLRMPGLSGLALKARIDEDWPDLASRLAFITGDAMSQDAETIRKATDSPLLEKPVAPGELRDLIRLLTKDPKQETR